MLKIGIGGHADIQKLHRLVRDDEILVGYPDGVTHPDSEKQNSDLARDLHNGTSRIPARPFLYQSIVSVRQQLREMIREQFKKQIKRGEYSPEGIGAFMVGAVQRFVRSGYYKNTVPNAPSTIRRKSRKGKVSDTPLIDTGFLINSTTYITRKHPPKLVERNITVKGETP
jgi:hypothetical protein